MTESKQSDTGTNIATDDQLDTMFGTTNPEEVVAEAVSTEEDPITLERKKQSVYSKERQAAEEGRKAAAKHKLVTALGDVSDIERTASAGARRKMTAYSDAAEKSGLKKQTKNHLKVAMAERKRLKSAGRDLQEGIDRQQGLKKAFTQQYSEAKVRLKQAAAESRLEAETNFTNINNQINELRSEDPGQPIFGSSWGIAAALMGSLRQGLFGGDNNAMKMMNKMVEQAAKQQMANIKNLQGQGTSAGKLIDSIIKGASSDQKLLSDLYKANLKDVKDSMANLIQQYNIKINQNEDLTLSTAFQKITEKTVDADTKANSSYGSALIDLAAVKASAAELTQGAYAQMASDTAPLAPTKAEIGNGKTLKENVVGAVRSLKMYSGIIASFQDLIQKDENGNNIPRGTWERFKAQGSAYLPSFIRSVGGSEAMFLKAQMNAAIFAEIQKTQTKISDADFKAFENYVPDGGASDEAFADRMERLTGDSVKLIRDSMTSAANIRIYPSNHGIVQVLSAMPAADIYRDDPVLAGTLDVLREDLVMLSSEALVGGGPGTLQFGTTPSASEVYKYEAPPREKKRTWGEAVGQGIDAVTSYLRTKEQP